VRVREALPGDGPALKALQARCPEGEGLVVDVVNEPDFFARAKAYGEPKIFAACEGERVVGSVACALREVEVAGAPTRVGYMFQAFVAPEARRRGVLAGLLAAAEEHLRARGARLSYALIIEGNAPSARAFAKAGYRPHRPLVLAGVPVFRKMPRRADALVRASRPADLGAAAALLNETWRGHALRELFSAEQLSRRIEETPAYREGSPLLLEVGGALKACAGVWERSRVTRITVRALSLRLRLLGAALAVARRLAPLPRVPKPGETLKQWTLTPVGGAPGDLRELLYEINNQALGAGVDQLFLLCERGHPMLGALGGLYRVDVGCALFLKPLAAGLTLGDAPVYAEG
jgi:GNAT superfamily N-acetyltransferase